ncbi:hypothetical protein [Jeotgalibacillus proteolyticus]|uniref:hypothetical protein n=1 Tax=Jeotgalibacillus proteolyticus TaxID=2082395 RepID=UPI003CF20725
MSHLDEFDALFKDLRNIERSTFVKEQSLTNILQSKRVKKSWYSKQRFIIPLTSLVACFIVYFFLNTYFSHDNMGVSEEKVELHISSVMVKTSQSDLTFEINSTTKLNTLEINNDDSFMNSLENFISEAEQITTAPNKNLYSYDLNIVLENSQEIKVEIWENGDALYMYDFSEDRYYSSTGQSASNLHSMLVNIPYLPQ